MKHLFIPLELNIKLRNLGFDEPCFSYMISNFNNMISNNVSMKMKITNSKLKKEAQVYKLSFKGVLPDRVAAATYDQAFDFIQDKFGMTGLIFSDGFNWTFDLRWVEDDFTKYPSINFPKSELERIWSDTYKKAKLKCLIKLIEIADEKTS